VTTDFGTLQTPESVVFQLVETATGQTPVRRQKIVYASQEVYCVAMSGGAANGIPEA
jgi:hypothetical protein